MPTINPIILEGLKSYLQEKPEIPQEMNELIGKLLQCEANEYTSKDGIDKIYDQILEKFINNDSLIEWSNKYGN